MTPGCAASSGRVDTPKRLTDDEAGGEASAEAAAAAAARSAALSATSNSARS